MIDDDILNEIKQNFYQGSDHEMLIIPNDEIEAFWNWFAENGSIHTMAENNNLFHHGSYRAGRCFGNSQTASLNHQLEYYEGFAKVNGRFIFHGFNIIEDQVVDVTVRNYEDIFLDFNGVLPNDYVGIYIPTAMIIELNAHGIANEWPNIPHLLYRLYETE